MGLGMTAVIITGGIDLSVGLGPLPRRHGQRHDDGVRSIRSGMAIPGGACSPRVVAGGVSGYLIAYVGMAAVRGDARHDVARPKRRDGACPNNTMVFQFGADHAKFIALGGGSTRDWFDSLAGLAGPGHGTRRRR